MARYLRRHAIDREQGHAQIAHFLQYAMQCSLIEYRSCEQRIAVLFPGDGQPLEPLRPLLTQMTLDPDLIKPWLTFIGLGSILF